jgi:hypothetical protein
VEVTRAAGEKCPRCWNIRELGTDVAHPAVCGRCAAVLTELGFVEPEDGEPKAAGAQSGEPKAAKPDVGEAQAAKPGEL